MLANVDSTGADDSGDFLETQAIFSRNITGTDRLDHDIKREAFGIMGRLIHGCFNGFDV